MLMGERGRLGEVLAAGSPACGRVACVSSAAMPLLRGRDGDGARAAASGSSADGVSVIKDGTTGGAGSISSDLSGSSSSSSLKGHASDEAAPPLGAFRRSPELCGRGDKLRCGWDEYRGGAEATGGAAGAAAEAAAGTAAGAAAGAAAASCGVGTVGGDSSELSGAGDTSGTSG
jgi:hypothetical protein